LLNDIGVIINSKIIRHPFNGPIPLYTLLQALDVHLAMPCAGNHACGKCKIRVTGALSPISTDEACFLSEAEIQQGVRLACYAQVLGDIAIEPPQDTVCTLSSVSLPSGMEALPGYGLAVDVGTTTIAMQLYDRSQEVLVGEALSANQQNSFGADVISRIEFSNQHGTEALSDALHRQLEAMAASCLRQADISQVDEVVLTGNTTMLHFWERLDPRGIAVAPFVPVSLFGCVSAWPLAGAFPYLPPCTGAYVGGDITCSILASGLLERPHETSLLIDLGTNGEIVLHHGEKLLCASTAIGPAFEGANLSCGMSASPGAISSLSLSGDGRVSYRVIQNCAPSGICGSGVLDAVRIMLELGILDESGLICENLAQTASHLGTPAWKIPRTDIWITQADIRQIQLAKAAVFAGIETLLATQNLTAEEIGRFYIAGGFGHFMNLSSAARVGLFPQTLVRKAVVLGNASLSGAIVLLMHGSGDALAQIQRQATEIPLSGNPVFSESYIEHMMFEREFK
jgi:Uncharacterized metal-binding protein